MDIPSNRFSRESYEYKSFCEQLEKFTYSEKDEQNIKSHLGCFTEDQKFKKYGIWQTSPEDLAKHGLGLHLFFLFSKQFTWLFFFLSLFSIYPMISNYYGNGSPNIDQTLPYANFSISNQFGVSPFEKNLTQAVSDLIIIRNNMEKIWIIDISSSIFFTLFVLYYFLLSKKITNKSLQENLSVEDFAIMVKGYSEDVKAESVLEYFSEFGEISEIYISRKYKGKLMKYKKRFKLGDKLALAKKEPNQRNTLKKITKKLQKFDSTLPHTLTHDELPADRVFITFNKIESKIKCLNKKYNLKKKCCKNKVNPIPSNSGSLLKVHSAPNPSDILWENLEFTTKERFKVRIVVFIFTIILGLASFFLIFFMKSFLSSLPTNNQCINDDIDGTLTLEQARNKYKSQLEINCYCKQQALNDFVESQSLRDFCNDYFATITMDAIFQFVQSISILFINLILTYIIEELSKIEKFSTITKRRLHVLTRIFIIIFFNTSVSILIANAKFSINNSVIGGKYSDLNKEWYSNIGFTITNAMIVSIISPHGLILIFGYPYQRLKKCILKLFYKTKYKQSKISEKPSLDISQKISQILLVIFTCSMYSSGIPLLNMICFLALSFNYWTNKFLILRYYRRPPVYSANINNRVLKFLPFCVIFHCIISFYTFTCPEILPEGFKTNPESKYVIPVSSTFIQRLISGPGVSNVLVIIFNILLLILIFVFSNKHKEIQLNKVLNQHQLFVNTTRDILSRNKEIAVLSYDITENPKYYRLIITLNSAASKKQIDCVQSDSEESSRKSSDLVPEIEINEQNESSDSQKLNTGIKPYNNSMEISINKDN